MFPSQAPGVHGQEDWRPVEAQGLSRKWPGQILYPRMYIEILFKRLELISIYNKTIIFYRSLFMQNCTDVTSKLSTSLNRSGEIPLMLW